MSMHILLVIRGTKSRTMFLSKFVKDRTKQAKIADNLSTTVVLMFCLLCFTTYHAVTNKVIVQWTPPYINERITVGHQSATSALHIKYGMQLSLLLGNVTPKTIDYAIDASSTMFSPKLFHRLEDKLRSQAEQIKQKGDTLEFHPVAWDFEPSTGLTFITGRQIMRPSLGDPVEKNTTYEFKIKVDNYVPTVTDFDFYAGTAHNQQWRESQANKPAQAATQ